MNQVPVAHLKCRTLEELWLRSMYYVMNHGRVYRKDGGNRAGMLRKALDFFSAEITHPETRPLTPMPKPGCFQPCGEEDAVKYLDYLYSENPPRDNEHYTYAQFLTPQVHDTALHFAIAGLYNQHCVMQVGHPWDISEVINHSIEDGHLSIPCLRLVHCRIIDTQPGQPALVYYIFFRAWNLMGAMPLNMAGLQLLKEAHAVLISERCGREVVPGPSFVMSADLHINDIEWPAAEAWLGWLK